MQKTILVGGKDYLLPPQKMSFVGMCLRSQSQPIMPVIKGKKSAMGQIMMQSVWLHSPICEHVWDPLGDRTVKHAECMALAINIADVSYFR